MKKDILAMANISGRMRTFLLFVVAGSTPLVCLETFSARDQGSQISEPERSLAEVAAEYVPIHKWQQERVKVIQRESLEECIKNLPQVEDVHLAQTSVEGDTWDGFYQNEVVVNLARVRRILQQAYEDPEGISVPLELSLAEVLEDWDRAFAVFRDAIYADGNWADEWRIVNSYRIRAMSTIYVLAELNAHEALPIIVRAFRKYKPHTTMMPAAPALVLSSIHRLMTTYPKMDLPYEAEQVQREYSLRSGTLIAPAALRTVTRWNADYDDSDPRFKMFPEMKPHLLSKQPAMRVRVYSSQFSDGTEIGDWQGVPDPRAVELVDLVEKFLQAVETPSPWSL